jgi:hypothetical protein
MLNNFQVHYFNNFRYLLSTLSCRNPYHEVQVGSEINSVVTWHECLKMCQIFNLDTQWHE